MDNLSSKYIQKLESDPVWLASYDYQLEYAYTHLKNIPMRWIIIISSLDFVNKFPRYVASKENFKSGDYFTRAELYNCRGCFLDFNTKECKKAP